MWSLLLQLCSSTINHDHYSEEFAGEERLSWRIIGEALSRQTIGVTQKSHCRRMVKAGWGCENLRKLANTLTFVALSTEVVIFTRRLVLWRSLKHGTTLLKITEFIMPYVYMLI
ncbi:hypothetical protein GDO78_015544 [Eleutherodactylus coqui]|uniref:Uncharacterized protein n=1 Tax=Eleutherodactylus coqui TaxID=57060 RepID=A0A8J6JP13_ELECQ|nr:hypothetical protein GDO78_015544 [Eleutherodactylus coqui]